MGVIRGNTNDRSVTKKNFKVTQKKTPLIAAERFNNQTNSDQFFLRISDLQSHVKQ